MFLIKCQCLYNTVQTLHKFHDYLEVRPFYPKIPKDFKAMAILKHSIRII